ncbi:MAG: agmatine deiminase family protein [Verrucomicrobiae bacterium]|nr:agmatine deiminase family protein [Verrucomicrobiae bacterium]
METPRSLGFRMPAEWESQEAVWLSWPTNPETWPACWQSVQHTFAEIAVQLSRFEEVCINLVEAKRPEIEGLLKRTEDHVGLARGSIRFFNHPTNDVWVRDHGPIYLKNDESGEVALSHWGYNGWGEKYPYDLDRQIPALIANSTGLRCFRQDLVLEGGSVDSNGAGDLLVTTDCLLNPNRNPGVSQEAIEARLREGLGIERVHWLEACIEGDDTDGHIDNLARFFKKDGVLVAACDRRDDSQFEMLARLEEQCRELELVGGGSLEVLNLALPEPVFDEGRRLPMSYANFLIAQGVVLIPSFGQSDRDSEAASKIRQAFPGREIVSINCQNLILEGGALHCLTQQVPQAS